MEIKQFQEERNKQLSDFQTRYEFLKQQYSQTLLSAIQEKDPEEQQKLVTQVLEINTEMSNELRSIISNLNKGSNSVSSKTLNDLTNDLIEYQKQYNDIQQGNDRVQTLKMIQSSNDEKLQQTTLMFNIYIGVLLFLVAVLAYLAVRSNWVGSVQSTIQSIASPLSPTQ